MIPTLNWIVAGAMGGLMA
ncbi:Protein of unknown function [Bacillus cereus]|nr:Protein of unknown function [Bacillus cereus]